MPWLLNCFGASPATACKGVFTQVGAALMAHDLLAPEMLPPGIDIGRKLGNLFAELRRCGKKGKAFRIPHRKDSRIGTP